MTATVKFRGREVRTPILRLAIFVGLLAFASMMTPVHVVVWLFGFRGFFFFDQEGCLTFETSGVLKRA
jgi:hypothetical protein